MKRIRIIQFGLPLVLIFFLIFIFMPKNYVKKYEKNKVLIAESFNKNLKYYYFTFTYKDITLDYLIATKYKNNRGFIKDIKVLNKDEDTNDFCLIIDSEFNIPPLCSENNMPVSYQTVNNSLKSLIAKKYFPKDTLIKTYNDIEIYNDTFTYLLWNYNGFYYLNSKEQKKIDIFSNEFYTVKGIGYTKDYLILPDYDANYTFKRYYVLDFKSGNLKKYDLTSEIYFDSYFLGFLKNKLYLVDKKERKMYEFNAKNGKLEKIKSKIYQKGTWENVNIKTLINQEQYFTFNTLYNYTLENNNLYLNYTNKQIKTKISTKVTSIVRINAKDIFYLKKDNLYHFNPYTGEELLLNYFEWNFNYNNMIYLN